MLPSPYLHALGADPGRLLHTIRFDNAQWAATDDIARPDMSPITSIAATGDGATLHLFIAAGSVYHATRGPAGVWSSFDDIATSSGGRWSGALQVTAAVIQDSIHVCGVAGDGKLIHASLSGGVWTPPQEVPLSHGAPSQYYDVGCAGDGETLHLVGAPYGWPPPSGIPHRGGSSGTIDGLWYTVLRPDGSWDRFSLLISLQPPTGLLVRVGCAAVGGDLHIVASALGGARASLWHLMKDQNGAWTNFLDVKSVTGSPGAVADLAVANCANELHVMVSTSGVQNWRHTIRRANGTWQPFGDVWAATGGADQAPFSTLACAGLEPPSGAPVMTNYPALAFQFAPCLFGETAASVEHGFNTAVQRLTADPQLAAAGLLGGAKVHLACKDDIEVGGVFAYSESDETRAASVGLVDLFPRSKQKGHSGDFAILFTTGAINAALAAQWDGLRADDGRIRVPDHPEVELTSYQVGFPAGQLQLDVSGQTPIPGGLVVGFTIHYTDTFSTIEVTTPPDGLPLPHNVVISTDSAGVDVSGVSVAIFVFLIPGVLNALLGDQLLLHSSPPTLSGSLGGVVAQVFLRKLYLAGGTKLLFQYAADGVLTGADFGVQAFGSIAPQSRRPVLEVATQLRFGPVATTSSVLPGGVGPIRPPLEHASELVVIAATDDMMQPMFTFTATGLTRVSVTGSDQSPDGTRFTSQATFAVPHRAFITTVTVTVQDADRVPGVPPKSLSETVTVPLVVDTELDGG